MHRLGFSGLWKERRPRVAAWFARVQARPGFKAAFDAFKPVDYDDLLEKKGINLWPKMEPLLSSRPSAA
jgi:hypothetical protein